MPTLFQMFRVRVEDGVAQGDGELVTIALYAPGETIDPDDGADLRIVDADGDGRVDADEFRDATGGGGIGLNGGNTQLLFDGEPGSGSDGFLYSPLRVADGTDINVYIDQLGSSFEPVDLDDVATPDPEMPPGPAPVCFAAGTLIETPHGARAVETLRAGDLVLTRDSGPRPLIWVGGSTHGAEQFGHRPRSRPIRIGAGALGPGLPARDLVVSPSHRMLVASPIVRRMTGSPEALIAARKLLPLNGVAQVQGDAPVHYRHLLFDRHEIVFSEGAPSESLFNGPNALKSLAALTDQNAEELGFGPGRIAAEFAPARPFVKGRKAENLVARHISKGMPLLAGLAAEPGFALEAPALAGGTAAR